MTDMYAMIIILIVALILAGIAASAVQQHKERKEAELRDEMARQKSIIDDTESAITLAGQMPVSQQLIALLHKRVLSALKQSLESNPQPDTKQRIADSAAMIKNIDVTEPAPDLNTFRLPQSDKVIIKYIQAIKKLRVILRSENQKGNVPPKVFAVEDKALEKLQLRVNVETLGKRANDAIRTNMQGSAKQYVEKAIAALKKQNPQDDYTTARTAEFEQMLSGIDAAAVKNIVSQAQAGDQNKEDIDSLFAPKKKW